jgi:HSP20 family molecular chaperone IbpA
MRKIAEVVKVKQFETPEKTSAAIFDELRQDLADWMTADVDLVWRPAIELTEEGGEFAVRALLPGIDPADIQVLVAPDALLIKGEVNGKAGYNKLLRSVKFRGPVDPDTAHAEIKNGMLTIRVEIAGAQRANSFMPMALAA